MGEKKSICTIPIVFLQNEKIDFYLKKNLNVLCQNEVECLVTFVFKVEFCFVVFVYCQGRCRKVPL